MKVWLPDLEQVLAVHAEVLSTHGGTGGLGDRGALESCLQRPNAGFGEHEVYPDAISKAAILGYAICTAHAFVDGNKRCALLCMTTTLKKNQFDLLATDDQLEELMLETASGGFEPEDFVAAVRRITVRRLA